MVLGRLQFFLVPVLFGQSQYVPVDAGELGLGLMEIFCCKHKESYVAENRT